MANAVQKITLNASRDIPFNKLVLSQSNVRRVKAGISIEDLSEDIARRGLLQSLSVRPMLDADGAETGMFEVPAGGRRYRALELLVKQKRLAKAAPVPCIPKAANAATSAEEDSLAENVQHVGLHPLDQFRAFQALREKGQSEEDIAAVFFVSVHVVKQRLRLAAVSNALLDLYAQDGITLEQLMAFTVTGDHARQEQAWEAIQHSYSKEPYQIRRMLTETTVRASDKRAQFVGLDAYAEAGGGIMRDLFKGDDGGWLEDAALLDRLVGEKLKAEAETVAAEGWKWISVAVETPYGYAHGLRELAGTSPDLTAEEQATIEALKAEYAKLEAEYEEADELPDDVDERLGEIEMALATFGDRPAIYDPAETARAGVFVSIDSEGRLSIDRGYVRPEDEAPSTADGDGMDAEGAAPEASDPSTLLVQRAVITIGGQAEPEDDEDDIIKPLPDRLVSELTAHRTLALRDALANEPSVAFLAVLHKFCLDVFSRYSSHAVCMEIAVRNVGFAQQGPGLKESASAQAVDARHKAWEERLPRDQADLWDALAELEGTEQAALFAHCASFGVNALHEKADRYGAGPSASGIQRRLDQADVLARAVSLDMVAAGWKPTVDNYLSRVTKPRILEAVREAKGEQSAQLIDHLKKGDMAKEAERLLDGTAWLPEPLRLAEIEPASELATEGETEALPSFLAGDDDEIAADTEEERQRMIAAE
jgi:ParB family chromosome partitioning protein